MPISTFDQSLNALKNPSARSFYAAAMAMIRQNGEGYVTARQTSEFSSWMRYFESLNWVPTFMQIASIDGTRQVTLPCQWPEWFSSNDRVPIKQSISHQSNNAS